VSLTFLYSYCHRYSLLCLWYDIHMVSPSNAHYVNVMVTCNQQTPVRFDIYLVFNARMYAFYEWNVTCIISICKFFTVLLHVSLVHILPCLYYTSFLTCSISYGLWPHVAGLNEWK
jgi:hypothetical protein